MKIYVINTIWQKWAYPGRDRAVESHPSSTKKLMCFYGGHESLPPHLHLVKQSSGRSGDTPPVGRQDALLEATVGAPSLLLVTV